MTARRLRILQVLTCDAIGGTELTASTLVRRIDAERFECEVAFLASPGPISAGLRTAGVPTHSFGGRARARGLASLLRGGRFDIVHAYGFRSPMLVRVLARAVAPRTAVIVGVQGLTAADRDEVDDGVAHALFMLERLTSPLVDLYEVNSRGGIELLARWGVDRRRLRYIPNGIDSLAWPFRPREAPGEPPLVLSVSRFATRKRQRDLVLAAAKLKRRGIAFRMTLAGDGPTLAEVTALAGAHDLGDVVTFAGAVDAAGARALLAEADVFCQPSLWEGMPATVLEAMATGVPVVGTAVNGIEDLVEPGRTGWLAPVGQPERLADALAEALAAPHDVRRRYADAARARVEAEFTVEVVVAAREELYEQVIRGRA